MNCCRCGVEVENKNKGYCPSCKAAYNKLWYAKNKDIQIARTVKNNMRYRALARKFTNDKKNEPCADCGEKYPPYVMDFDHRDGAQKRANVSRMATTATKLWKIADEAEKCDVVCSNCHRERTHQRRIKAQNNAGVSPQFPKLTKG